MQATITLPSPSPREAQSIIARNLETHRNAKRCACGTPTHHIDRRGRPLCACCQVEAMPKDPRLSNWRNKVIDLKCEHGCL